MKAKGDVRFVSDYSLITHTFNIFCAKYRNKIVVKTLKNVVNWFV